MTEIVELVQRRHEILEALEGGPLGKPALTDSTSYARSTVDRGLDELEEADLVRSEGSEYRLSTAGRRILQAFDTFQATASVYQEYATAIEGVQPEDELPPVLLDGAEVETATPAMPTRPVKKAHEGLAEADAVYSTCPVLLAYHSEFWNAAQPETDVHLEVIYTTGVLETMRSEYPDWREDVVDSGLLTPYVGDDVPSYGLALVDGLGGEDVSAVRIQVYDEDGVDVLLHNESEAAVGWARERYEALRADAEPVT